MMAVINVKMSPQEELQLAFQHFDVKGKGKVSKDEVMQVMKELGQNLSPQELADIMEVCDADRDGYIVFNDFKELMGVQ